MARLDNWQNNLAELIEEKRSEPFQFGTFDCSLWACMAIEAVTGHKLHESYLGAYKTAKGALKKLRQIDNVKTPLDFFIKYLGETKGVGFAKPGDVVFASSDNLQFELPADSDIFGPVIGVCYGSHSIFLGETGLVFVETLKLDGCLCLSSLP